MFTERQIAADSGSTYEPHPVLTYEWDPDAPHPSYDDRTHGNYNGHGAQPSKSFDLGPHPADPHSITLAGAPQKETSNGSSLGPNYSCQDVPGQEIWVYGGNGGFVELSSRHIKISRASRTFTFWRFMIHIPLGTYETPIYYSINKGQKLHFFVPGRKQNMRWAAYSVCLTSFR